MNVKPSDLFFGLMEFLAFIVPGFILCITFPDYLSYYFYWDIPESFDIADKDATLFMWLVFVMVSYIAGHFLHHICALLLNPLYERTHKRRKLRKYQAFVDQSEQMIKEKLPLHANYLKTAEAYLRVHQPSVVPELERHEANSKLFRSLSLLSFYLCCYPHIHWMLPLLLIPVSVMSFFKFANERWNHHFLVYEYFSIVTTKQQ